jgi:hypothetical protein
MSLTSFVRASPRCTLVFSLVSFVTKLNTKH